MGGVEQRQNVDGDLAALEVEGEQFVDGGDAGIELGEGFDMKASTTGSARFIWRGVVGVGGHALEAVEQQLLQAGDIFTKAWPCGGRSSIREPGEQGVFRRLDGDARGGVPAAATTLRIMPRIEAVSKLTLVTVTNRASSSIGARFRRPLGGGHVRVAGRKALGGVDEHVLQVGSLRRLAADAARHAAGSAGGLFTLIAKHLSVSILGAYSPSCRPSRRNGGDRRRDTHGDVARAQIASDFTAA